MKGLVAEYSRRRMLAELGYRFDGSKLSSSKAEAFYLIASEYQRVDEKERDRK